MKVCWKRIFGQVVSYITMEGICSWWHSYSWPSLSNHQWIFIFCQKEGESSQNPRSKTGYFFCFPSEQLVPKCWWLSALLCSQNLFHLELIQYLKPVGDLVFLLGELVIEFVRMGEDLLGKPNVKNAALLWAMPVFFTLHHPFPPFSIFVLLPPFSPFISKGNLSSLSNLPCFNCWPLLK